MLNPRSGRGSHGKTVRARAEALGYGVEETASAESAVELARGAVADGHSTIVAAGGDGTVNQVVRGIDRAGGYASVTLGVVPVGTGNNFARQLGITDTDTAFAVLRDGERRRIDLGSADGNPFVNSCVAGLTADSSGSTSPQLKRQLGVLAYLVTTLRTVSDFESLRLSVQIDGEELDTPVWTGEALSVLVGNGRRFVPGTTGQANLEDGRFDVTVVEDVPVLSLMSSALLERLLGRESPYITRFLARSLRIRVHDPAAVRFSLDGEIIQARTLSCRVRPRTLRVAVGPGYTADPY